MNRWEALSAALGDAGVEHRLTTTAYVGGTYYRPARQVGYQIDVRVGKRRLCVADRWLVNGTDTWLGWAAWLEDPETDLVGADVARTKNPGELVALIQACVANELSGVSSD